MQICRPCRISAHREWRPILRRQNLLHVDLDLRGIRILRESQPIRQPPHVRIDDERRLAEDMPENHVRGLAPHSRNFHELLPSSMEPRRRSPRRSSCAAPISERVFCRKNPVLTINSSTCRGSAAAIARASGYSLNSRGVTRLTPTSVDCAERIVAARHCHGVSKSRLMRAFGIQLRKPARDPARALLQIRDRFARRHDPSMLTRRRAGSAAHA